jgi:hypothetical protein
MTQFSIDVDAEAVFLDGGWYTREDLSRRIKAMIDAGDFNIASASLALQELTQTMQGIRTLAFRCTPELSEALNDLAGRMGQSVSYLVREAVTQFITDATSAPPQQAPAPSESTVRVQQPELVTGATHDELQKVIVEEQPMVIAGPGAMRAAGMEPAPIELRRQATPEDGQQIGEGRWFKQ